MAANCDFVNGVNEVAADNENNQATRGKPFFYEKEAMGRLIYILTIKDTPPEFPLKCFFLTISRGYPPGPSVECSCLLTCFLSACQLGRLVVCLLACLVVCLLACLVVCLLACMVVCLLAWLVVCLVGRLSG